MRKIFKNYRNLIGLAGVVMLAVALFNLGMSGPVCFALVACWQLLQFARSPRLGACFMAAMTEAQLNDFSKLLKEMDSGWGAVKGLPDRVKGLEKENDELRGHLKSLRKMGLRGMGDGVRWIGNKAFVSDDCAAALTSVFVLSCARLENGLEHLIGDPAARERIKAHAAGILSMEIRTAMTGTEIPLPTVYVPQVIELVFKYGQARQYATVFPLGAGTVKLPRLDRKSVV